MPERRAARADYCTAQASPHLALGGASCVVAQPTPQTVGFTIRFRVTLCLAGSPRSTCVSCTQAILSTAAYVDRWVEALHGNIRYEYGYDESRPVRDRRADDREQLRLFRQTRLLRWRHVPSRDQQFHDSNRRPNWYGYRWTWLPLQRRACQ